MLKHGHQTCFGYFVLKGVSWVSIDVNLFWVEFPRALQSQALCCGPKAKPAAKFF
jgi:hypothetical protein